MSEHQIPIEGQEPEQAQPDGIGQSVESAESAGNAESNAFHNHNEFYEWMESWVFAVAAIVLVFTFLVRSATVSGISMLPTLHDREQLILQQVGYHDPQFGDVVVIDRTMDNDPPLIKRVIGRAGDTIDIDFDTGAVMLNGAVLDEPYINEPTVSSYEVAFPVTVPDGHVFVMGDNRNHSMDSRSSQVGMVDLRRVMGKAVFRFFPLNRIGGIS